MINKDNILADLHIHTIGSQHAYSTLKECVECAENANLKYIAITDHYYNDGTELNRKNEVNRFLYLEEKVGCSKYNVKVIGGAEFNLLQEIPEWNKLRKLKWKMIGAHGWFFDRNTTTLKDLYEAFELSADKFSTFAHIEREVDKIESKKYADNNMVEELKNFYDRIILLTKEKNVILELNEASLKKNNDKMKQRVEYWLLQAKDNGNIISLGTDAHYCEEIGKFDNTIDMINYINFPRERIINCNDILLNKLFRER